MMAEGPEEELRKAAAGELAAAMAEAATLGYVYREMQHAFLAATSAVEDAENELEAARAARIRASAEAEEALRGFGMSASFVFNTASQSRIEEHRTNAVAVEAARDARAARTARDVAAAAKERVGCELQYAERAARTADAALAKAKAELVAVRVRQEQIIDAMRAENDESAARGHRFARVCHVCNADNPRRRVILTRCGHVICRECAEKTRS
ncbi:hypothetical protein PENTCL1PPCAC_30729 [Pristionchus entomophagus]|uniref:RING-type domain-containing protein n=1 Tax=Pristionchus entomophagus TaxID=358040 RepID=A0AAV5UN37_9BILA|nr:hypothetical protein PENTCL1PPCAC_30729 [Pristionchus entomophagus]